MEDARNQQQILMLEKLFDAKLKPLADDITAVKTTLNGVDGRPGIVEEVRAIKQKFGYIMAGLSFGVSILTMMVQEFLKGRFKA